MIAKPYSYMKERGLIQEMSEELKLITENAQIQEILEIPDIKDEVTKVKQD